MILLIDNYDSFTFNLVDYFFRAGKSCEVIRNDEGILDLNTSAYEGIVISPGPGRPAEAGQLMEFLRKNIDQRPMLGICLGHQALGEYFGATLIHAPYPMHGKISPIAHAEDPLFRGIPERFEVVRYHSLILSEFPETLISLAETETQENMAFRHRELPVYGLQFHPEAILTEHGPGLIRNWTETLQ